VANVWRIIVLIARIPGVAAKKFKSASLAKTIWRIDAQTISSRIRYWQFFRRISGFQ